MLPIAPEVFNRIEFGSIRRKVFDCDQSIKRIEKLSHQFAAMGGQTVPDHYQWALQVLEQMGQKQNCFFFAHGLVENLKVEIPEGHPGCDGDGFPVEVILQHWGLSSRRPGAAAVRSLAQSAFVDEDDRAAFFLGFFLTAGQVFRFHATMASSLRSKARPAGRCGVQFSCRSSFQTWPA